MPTEFSKKIYLVFGALTLMIISIYAVLFPFNSFESNNPHLQIQTVEETLEPNELTALTVSLDGKEVQGATVRADSLNLGETNRNGKLMFRGLEEDFLLNVTYEDYYTTDKIDVEEDASVTREASDDS